jgi:hypothetical protein
MTSEGVAAAHGLLDSAALSRVHSDADRLVIGPCAVALLVTSDPRDLERIDGAARLIVV